MADKAHVGLVDAHAEGDGGDDDDAVFSDKAALVGAAGIHAQAGVVGQGVEAVGAQKGGHVFHAFAAQAVHNAAVAGGAALEKVQKLLFAVVFFDDLVVDVRPIKARYELGGGLQVQIVFDVGAGFGVGGGGERDARHGGIALG